MGEIEKIVILLTGVGMFALVLNFPQVPLSIVNAITTIMRNTIRLAGPPG